MVSMPVRLMILLVIGFTRDARRIFSSSTLSASIEELGPALHGDICDIL